MKIQALTLIIVLFLTVCDVPVFSDPVSEDPYRIYNAYRTSLLSLQQDIAQVYLELQEKNPQALYEHMLQVTEKTAVLIGNAETASHYVEDGFQGSLRGHLELLLEFGPSEKQKNDLINLGYTEDDIAKILDSLAYYNDNYYRAVEGFTPEQIERFSSMGLTDTQIAELQAKISDHYTQIHSLEEEIKKQQKELLCIQVSLSAAALKVLLDLKGTGKDKSAELKNAEEKLLEAIANVSEDKSSLEKVKAYSQQVYKAAEQKIRKGDSQYSADFFIGLHVHCGAVTALNGDPEFGLREIRSYESALLECISTERPVSSLAQSTPGGESSLNTVSVPAFVGQIEESDETNNVGQIIVLVKAGDTELWEFLQMLAEWGVPQVVQEAFKNFLANFVSVETASFVVNVGGVVFALIMTAPPVGASWVDCVVDCMTTDPSGIFAKISEDENTVKTIELGTQVGEICERSGYNAVYKDPGQIVYTIMLAVKVYKSPYNHYFYYMRDMSGAWVVEVEGQYGCGRVVTAYRVDCDYECHNIPCTILEKWVLCDNFTLVWSGLQPTVVWT